VKAAQVMQDVGRRVAELRSAREITQEGLAERARVDARTVQRAEAGRHLTLVLLIRIADVLDVPMTALFEPPSERERRRPGRPPRAPTPTKDVATNPVPARTRGRAAPKRERR
jgi:transcriptional regulator with XRE-family HTH domain